MLHLIINEEKKQCPICWQEVDVRTFQAIMRDFAEGDNQVKLLSILTDTTYGRIYEAESEDLDAAVYQATAFVFNEPQTFRKVTMPATFTVGGKSVTIPTKLNRLTIGQNFTIRAAMAKAANLESLISLATAVYLQPLVDESKFDLDRAKELEVAILKMNVFEVFPIGFFLLSKLNNSGASGLLDWLLKKIRRMRSGITSQRRLALASLSLCMISVSLIATPKPTVSFPAMSTMKPLETSCHSSSYGKSRMSFKVDSPKSKRP